MSAFGGKADMTFCGANVCFWPKADMNCPLSRNAQHKECARFPSSALGETHEAARAEFEIVAPVGRNYVPFLTSIKRGKVGGTTSGQRANI